MSSQQINAYKGRPRRAWIRVILIGAEGTECAVDLLADTGNPFSVVVGLDKLQQFGVGKGVGANSNFGRLTSRWLQIAIPDLGFQEEILSFASETVLTAVQGSHPDFHGLVGLPFLRKLNFGGDSKTFWIRSAD